MHAGGDIIDMKAEQYEGEEAAELHFGAAAKKRLETGGLRAMQEEGEEANFLTLLYQWEEASC